MNKIFFFLLLVSLGVQGQTKMSSQEANTLKQKVQERARTTQTMSSAFTQYKHMDFLSKDIVTKGKISFKAPDLVRWEYTDPFNYIVIFKNESIHINDDGVKNSVDLGSNAMFKNLSQLIVNSISGAMFDEKEFNISFFKNEKRKPVVHFEPKRKELASYISAFHITFNDNGDVDEVKMISPSEDYTRIVFSNKTINKNIPDAVFEP